MDKLTKAVQQILLMVRTIFVLLSSADHYLDYAIAGCNRYMDTELLRTFLELEKTRHFGRAADNLYLTQAAVSSRIRQLEGLLGAPLFTRYRNNISLTLAGERLKPHAQSVLAIWGRAMQEAALAEDRSMQLAIGGAPNVWDTLLQRQLHIIHQQLPELVLRAEALPRELCTQHLLSRQLDLAVLFDPPKIEELKVDPLMEITLCLVGAEDTGAVERNYVQVDWGTSFGIHLGRLNKVLPPPVLSTSTARIALDFILDNGGAAFLPLDMVDDLLRGGQLACSSQFDPIKRPVYAVYLKQGEKRETIDDVLSRIR